MKCKLFTVLCLFGGLQSYAAIPDSVFVRPLAQGNGGGMRLEWSSDKQSWNPVCDGNVLSSDFGTWGAEKKLYSPSMVQGRNGEYVIVFSVNDRTNQFAVTTTADFLHWRPQHYPYIKGVKQCLTPVITKCKDGYEVAFVSEGKTYSVTTTDLVHFSEPKQVVAASPVALPRVAYNTIQAVKAGKALQQRRDALHNESARDDARRFAGLTSVKADIVVDGAQPKAISDKLMGIFFEDINYSADGGLYAELIQNRDFQYNSLDNRAWNSETAWHAVGDMTVSITDQTPVIHPNNANYALLTVNNPATASYRNEGFDGIVLKKGDKYDFSMFLRQQQGKGGKVNVVLREGDRVVGRTTISAPTGDWKQQKAVITATADAQKAELCIEPTVAGQLCIDFVSLFPQKTFHGHKNGLRPDLAQTLADLHPRFMRFPGGCVAHGNGLENMYNWKETIGPLWERKTQSNIWNYHQSRGLGYFEFFQFCEDLNMEPLPIIPAGVPCQNSSRGGYGQQGGVPMADMPAFIQDILDLIEWANGDAKTTQWGRKRAEAGHPKPFNLHYIGIGNEDLISPAFEERYLMIIKAVKEKHPEITICGTVGPFFQGSDYDEGWKIATENHIDMVDEHYYVAPGWYIHNHDFYDNYDRTSSKVYLGEWASHIGGRKSTIETALSCALHYCSLERNGDIVEMSSYAPLLAKEGHTQWNPDLIYFNNTEVHPTVDYWAQQLHGQYSGNQYLTSTIRSSERREGINERLAISTVRDSQSGRTYLKVVSMMPVEVDAHLTLKDLGLTASKECKSHVLTGAFDDQKAKPADITVAIAPDGQLTIPAYSFMVIEL